MPFTDLRAEQLIEDRRVNFVAPADYSSGRTIDTIVKAVINKIASDCELDLLGKQE